MSTATYLNRNSPPHITTLVAAAAFGPLAMNIFLPSLPAIATHFDAPFVVVQFAISLYLIANAFLQILIGPLSDRYGRRPVMMFFSCLAIAATVLAIYAPTIEIFLLARGLQGTAIAGMVIGRAVIRDMVGPDESASKIGYVTMGMTLAPMLGPILGGYLDEFYGWQASFWALIIYGFMLVGLLWLDLGETSRYKSASFSAQFRSYPALFTSRRFWGYSVASAAGSGAFFAFLGGSAYLASVHYDIPPSLYGFYFIFAGIGYIVGNFISGRFARKIGINRMMMLGGVVACVGMLISLALVASGLDHRLSFFGPVVFIGLGNGITLPSSIAGIVSVRPEIAGSASGLGGFFQIGGGALLSVLGGAVLGTETGPMPLILLMLASSFASVLATAYVMHIARTVALQEADTTEK
ncbi:MAG: multidrug effflux MFS transporter [Pseudomonadota bacterium]